MHTQDAIFWSHYFNDDFIKKHIPGLGAFVPDLVIIEDKEFDATIFCGFWATWVDTFSTVDPNFCSVGV